MSSRHLPSSRRSSLRVFSSLALGVLATFATSTQSQTLGYVGKERVSVYHDASGIPHVFGDTDEAAFYGLGYHQMIDFPVGTLNMLWLHSGRMAEIAGASYLDEDRQVLLWDVPVVAARHRAELQEKGLLKLIRAYVRGIEEGRKWWRQKESPNLSSRLKALLGPALQVRLDPVPNYLNQAFSPYGSHDDPNVPVAIRRVLDRMFEAEYPITVEHVLRLGVCLNSFFMYRSNNFEFDVLPSGKPPFRPVTPYPVEAFAQISTSMAQANKLSNGWLLNAGNLAGGGVTTLCDNHIPLNKLALRPYLIQIQGDRYSATGLSMPGYPGIHEGFNDDVSWLNTAQAGSPVARNEWDVDLLPSLDPTDLKFEFLYGPASDTVHLQKVTQTLSYYDPVTDTDKLYVDARYYVPVHPAESPALGFTRYPVVPDTTGPPLPGETITFKQSAFTTEGSPWEMMLRMGRARNAGPDVSRILTGALMIIGNGNNLLVADKDGTFRYFFMARIPRQGSDVPNSMYDEGASLDGHQLGWRWAGYHRLGELPQIGPTSVTGLREAWICNNVTPDHVESFRFDEADLANYPEYMVSQESISTWRQLRAEELLRNAQLSATQTLSEDTAADVRDTWSHMMWPFFEVVPSEVPGGINADATLFMSWMNQYRSHDENDQPNAAYDFEAHSFSQVTLYAMLLRSHYLDELAMQTVSTPNEQQTTFGHDALHELFDNPGDFTYTNYAPNIDSMKSALETVAAFWKLGTGPTGLTNQALAATWSPTMPGDPWADPRYDTDIDNAWLPFIDGTKVTRWGHTNMLTVTPHYLPPPKRQYIDGVGTRGGDPYQFLRGYVYSGLQPGQLESLPYENLKVPFYANQPPLASPVPGTDTSLFLTKQLSLYNGSPPVGYQEAKYEWSVAGDSFDWTPETAGAQSLFSVTLRPGVPARARFLQALAGTEVVGSDLLGNGELAHQRRYAATGDFVERTWRVLETQRGNLGSATWKLKYGPELVDE